MAEAPKAPKIGPEDRVDPVKQELLPLGAGKKPLGSLEPILSVPRPLRNPNDKPKDEKLVAERVRLHARDQVSCPVPYTKIEARKVTDEMYRVNFLAPDKSEKGKPGFGQPKRDMVIETFKRVHSALVRVVWSQKQVILTVVP